MSREIAEWLKGIPFAKRRELAEAVREEAEGLKEEIKVAAPRGATLNLSESVEVRRTRNSLVMQVTAGGARTSKEVRGGSGVPYDYALGVEFGNERVRARPFFFTTARARAKEIQQRLAEKVARIMAGD